MAKILLGVIVSAGTFFFTREFLLLIGHLFVYRRPKGGKYVRDLKDLLSHLENGEEAVPHRFMLAVQRAIEKEGGRL